MPDDPKDSLLIKQEVIKSIIQSSAVATFVIDANHKVVYWNKACEELTGVKAEEIVNTSNHWKAFYDYNRPCLVDLVVNGNSQNISFFYNVSAKSELIEGLHAEGWYSNLGGKNRYIIFDAVPVCDESGNKIAAIETLQDITLVKTAEKALRISEQKFRDLVETITDWVWEIDKDLVYVYVSPKVRDLLGYEPNEVLGKSPFDFMPESATQDNRETLKDKYNKRVPISRFENIKRHKDGHLLVIETNAVLIVDEKGLFKGYRGVSRDITERKRAEEELKKAYNQLKLYQSQLIQSEKMDVVGRLASGVAHEVKNPLAIILQGIDYLFQQIPKDQENIFLILDCMNDAVQRADNIIKGLLDFSSISELNMQPEDLNAVIDDVLLLIKNPINKHHIKIQRAFAEDNPRVNLDKNKIQQVLVNLCMNAIEAMPDNGQITLRTYRMNIADEAGDTPDGTDHPDKSVVVVEIEDTGPGITDDIFSQILDPFFTTKRDKGGTGLGLTIVKSIIEMHGGKIKFENRKEQSGLRVTLMFSV